VVAAVLHAAGIIADSRRLRQRYDAATMRHLRRFFHCIAAGAVSGAALAPLQLLMWPEMSLGPGKAALVLFAWSSWGALWIGLAFFVVTEALAPLAPSLGRGPGFSPSLWRWLEAASGVLVGSVAWLNHRLTRELLLPDHRQALEVGAYAALVFILVVAAWGVARRRIHRSRRLAALTAGAFVAGMWALWAATPPPAVPEPPPPAPSYRPAHRVLVFSWEGADLTWLLPAMENGDMPFLAEHWGGGAWGQLRSVRPYSRSGALATLATGCLPAVHGVAGRRVYRLRWLQEEPVTLLLQGPWPTPHQLPWRAWERAAAPPPRRAPVWQILTEAGVRVGIAGWSARAHATWSIPRVLAADAMPYTSLEEGMRDALQPALNEMPEFAPGTRDAFAIAVEEVTSATLHLAGEPVDALVVDTDLPSRVRPMWTDDQGDPARAEVLRQALRLLDDQLRALWGLMGGEDTILVLVSPYGMSPPSPWKRLLNAVRGNRRWQVAPSPSADGFLFLAGSGVRGGTRLRGARITDVVPTLLYLVDLPVARDMAGRVLVDAISEERVATTPLRLIPSYPNLEPGSD
jgi:hypothetical protein